MDHYRPSLLMGVCMLLLASCVARGASVQPQAAAQPTPTATSGLLNCPITRPPDIPFAPPAPYSAKLSYAYAGQFWYGAPQLWTLLLADGTWYGLPQTPAGYTQKLFWWRQGYSMYTEPNPALTVTGKRLDAPAPLLQADRATNALGDLGQGMLIGIEVPTLGCWEITGHYHGHDLSFVVRVTP